MVENLYADNKEPVKEDIAGDKERLEKKEQERQNQAQKDKVSFSFSWIAIVVRGIVGTVISIFVFTQANRIEDEDTMSRFELLADQHELAIEDSVDDLIQELENSGSLYGIFSGITDKQFNKFIQPFIRQKIYLNDIRWHQSLEELNISQEQRTILEKDKHKVTTYFTVPPSPEKALAGTTITFVVPVFNQENGQRLGYVTSALDLSELIYSNIKPKNHYATDIYVYDPELKADNQLLYFYNAEIDKDKLPFAKYSEITKGTFLTERTVKFGDKTLTFIYQATPKYTEHTWQATIAASIGILITSFIVVTAWILLEIEKRQFSNVLHEEHIQEIEGTIDLLENTQSRLIAQENLASLGGLTAGIAHEIKNPLNFINNFSTLSIDLVEDINTFLAKHQEAGTTEERDELYETMTTLKQNIDTIYEQGQRADSTIQRMLAHSRGKAGEWTRTDLHKILDEYLSFSFHGMRAKNSNFQVKIEKEFDSNVKEIEVVANDMSRVFLNLLNNAFQAVDEKQRKLGSEYKNPTVHVSTQCVGNYVRIRIRDNGIGITDEDKAKIFTPFFTTKPTGVGTGLGLSLSYNIVVREHGGSLAFDSKYNEFTEFIITIPLEPDKQQEVVSK
ncbi:MAG: HAMP domain-containing sensor histidine kinase [Chlamydiota bacterium]|nr:HAMP domain-containing sensor histidine kinase [Chlamydiota bacterium]